MAANNPKTTPEAVNAAMPADHAVPGVRVIIPPSLDEESTSPRGSGVVQVTDPDNCPFLSNCGTLS